MTPAMAAALTSGRAMVTALFQLDLPSGTRRLMAGAGQVQWGADTFKGYDPTIGTFESADEIREDVSGEAPNTSITIRPAPGANRANIAGRAVQLAPCKAWLAALTLDVNQHLVVVADPEPVFDGFIDQATISLDAGRDEVDYSLLSAFDYFFEDSEGQRLNGQFHRSVWAGEGGLDNVTGITKKLYWGAAAPPSTGGSSSIYSGGTGSGSGLLGNGFLNYIVSR
jgi:hypothetical protein